MRTLLTLLALICLPHPLLFADEYLNDDLPIREHMLMMDRHRDAFFADLNDPSASNEQILGHLDKLRIHLHRLFPKIPLSINEKNSMDLQRLRINYQLQILKSLQWTLDMEQVILSPAQNQEEKERKDLEIKNLSHQLNVIVGRGHRDFR